MTYLAGPGRSNEHEDQHVVAGDPAIMAWFDDGQLDHESALAIARHLDQPRTAYSVEVSGGHVWHCSLSTHVREGIRTDEEWASIARDFITAMGFDDQDRSRAPTRWVAVRHGVSKNGNDHIHIAVNLVREDGTKANVHQDFRRAQSASRALEVKYGLERLESVSAERSTRGYQPAERPAIARARATAKYEAERALLGPSAPLWSQLPAADRQARILAATPVEEPRHKIARLVRGCATASESEAEFVRRMRRNGLLVRPHYAKGTTDVIEGYKVAERPHHGERPIWYGGFRLGRDLSLPRLRDGWPDSPQHALAAAEEWNAAMRGRRVAVVGREAAEPAPEMWERYSAELTELRQQLRDVPLEDRETWSRVARQTAGAFAAWSNAIETEPGELAAAADAMAKSAQTFKQERRPDSPSLTAIGGAAMLLASATRGGQGAVAQAALLRSLLRFAQAVYDAEMKAGQLRQAQHIVEDVRARLTRIRDELTPTAKTTVDATAPAAASLAKLDSEAEQMLLRIQGGQRPATDVTSPVPAKLEPRRETKPTADRGTER
ncbi:relaxase/mobilization nuclease domain-containing protein [Agromyces sp. SYSU K20354]|uniref:relaxase/mobilization nuclease domain-containing protein n=1 Tax=Agromyces cavernae TaxID=2898659 RepID=UPI001E2CD4CD|nr:relaxase/mobilization nuclease domain-containing protein [Agromyces cavernae]MCD2444369.1 relaxase/mobilization nuclease domain-containing protein [Agromyces cavernae]